ncbi:MAG: crossover junction endodeoxyribonuclease RuvC [bacterium]
MIILGIDPGLRKTGYGFIRKNGGNISLIKSGTIKLDVKKNVQDRLYQLYTEFSELIKENMPDCMAIEKVFIGKNARSAFLIGEARAACIIAAMSNNIKVFEYATRSVKQGVAGYGDASKEALQRMVKLILNYDGSLEEDASDALALAIFHGNISETTRFYE